MKNMKTLMVIIAAGSALLTVGCLSMKTKVLTAPVVSMKQSDVAKPGQVIGPVNSKYCAGDETIGDQDSNIGLMDQVILKAEKEHKATYIKDAQFFTDGGNCMMLEGTAMK
ncbi:MAG: hypothetical protein U1F16_14135 [Turneriella sp.]